MRAATDHEIDSAIGKFRHGATYEHGIMLLEFVHDLPNGDIEVRKTSNYTGNRTKHIWTVSKLRLEFKLLIEEERRERVRELGTYFLPTVMIRSALKNLLETGDMRNCGTVFHLEPILRAAMIGDREAVERWINIRYPEEDELQDLLPINQSTTVD